MCGCGSSKVEKDSTYGDATYGDDTYGDDTHSDGTNGNHKYKHSQHRRQNRSTDGNYYYSNTYPVVNLNHGNSYHNDYRSNSDDGCNCFGGDGDGVCYGDDSGGDSFGCDGGCD